MHDLRRTLRSLRRAPGFTVLAAGTLALGIGSVTAMVTVVDQVLLEPLPVAEQNRLVVAWADHQVRDFPHVPLTWAAFDAARELDVFASAAAHGAWGTAEYIVRDGDGEVTLTVAQVLGDFFGTLGVTPVAGRVLRAEDDVPGAEPAAVISHGLWLRRYGGGADVVGETLHLQDLPFTVVGVLPPGFEHPRGAEVWIPERPLHPGWGDSIPHLELDLVARLAPGATAGQAKARLDRLFTSDPSLSAYRAAVAVVRPFPEVVLGELRPTILVLLGGAVLVLGVACFNVANLVLVRAGRQEVELAVRRALGEGRWRRVRGALLEGGVLGTLGLTGGAVVAWLAVGLLLPLAPTRLPRLHAVGPPDPGVLLGSALLTSVVVLALALVPVVRAERADPAGSLRGGARAGRSGARGGRRLLVMGQAALAVWVTAGGALVLRSVLHLQALEPGFASAGIRVVELDVPYARFQTPEDLPDRFVRAAERLEARSGIEAATAVLSRPLAGNAAWDVMLQREDQSAEEASAENPFLNFEPVLPDYFRDLAVSVSRGRPLGPDDGRGSPPVVVLNEAAAGAMFGGEEALGRRVRLPYPGYEDTWWTVVGVAADTRYRELLEARATVYVPLLQMPFVPLRYLLVRVSDPGFDLLPAVREAFQEVDPAIAPKGAVPLEDVLREPVARPRFAAVVLGLFGGVILLLAAVGVYGVTAASVRARTREMGVRMACGARPLSVAGLVLRQALGIAGAGVALGLVALWLSRGILASLLFGVVPADPTSLAGAAGLVLSAAAVACLVPALRAAAVEPAEVLRSE